jgi:hypothetical protein
MNEPEANAPTDVIEPVTDEPATIIEPVTETVQSEQ